MACVILPSETARLVYGYLVRENLNDIALQFLQSSPYLTDCCQIVKSGFQFNTKLMGKDLPDLLQEYSVIHNLVNNKVSLLCKTSLLYKRIKLRCESISEILELILFWKYKNSKNEENSSGSDKNEKRCSSQMGAINSEYKNNSDLTPNKISIPDLGESLCFNESGRTPLQHSGSNLSESFRNRTPLVHNGSNLSEHYQRSRTPTQQSGCNISENFQTRTPSQQSGNNICENFHSKLNSVATAKEMGGSEGSIIQCQRNELNDINDVSCKEKNSEFISMTEIPSANDNIYSTTNNIINRNGATESSLGSSTNVLTIDINPQNGDVMTSEIAPNHLESNEGTSGLESQIKIVRIEKESENESHLGVYSKPVEEDGNVNLENGSVVFVSQDVGNVTINQERNQIIVIPIDYYKSQGLENTMEIDNRQKHDSKDMIDQRKNEVIFEGVQTAGSSTNSVPQLYNDIDRHQGVDENIMTESDFLKTGHLIYNLEKELKTSEVQVHQQQLPPPLQETNEKVSVHQEPAPLILVSQAMLPQKQQRYRKILPKKEEPILHPIVVVQPLLESNKDLLKQNYIDTEPKSKEVCRRAKKKVVKRKTLVRQQPGSKKIENSESLSMPNIKTPMPDKVSKEGEDQLEIQAEAVEEPVKEVDIERTNEEKENLEKTETKKTETPVFVMRRNSKRLSLSTPRRRSHIRALEFETPPKKNEEKKAKTSPKAKVEQISLERKSVRNTLFKSPDPETTFKSPSCLKGNKKSMSQAKSEEDVRPLNELSIPIATRSPNTKLSDAWESLTGVGCVIGQSPAGNKMWDADLRGFITENDQEPEKKRMRKPEKQKDSRKTTKKKPVSTKKSKPMPVMVSPSKMSLTAKRNTYSINGNEEGSPIRSLLDDLKIVTPFKDIETIRPTEETPLTKLLRENINTIDIDLSMINTPSFPPTPSIVITPDLDDVSALSGANYYSPTKDCSKDKLLKITDYFKVDTITQNEKINKKETKEMHEKVIDDLICKAKEIIGLGGEHQEEGTLRRRPSGKILSMVKIQMLTQCDKKLCENIPINEENNFTNSFTNHTTLLGNLNEETTKSDLKVELEEKRKRALRKIKVVKENLAQGKNRVTRNKKRKRSGDSSKSERSKSDISAEQTGKQTSESDESFKREPEIFHSTPYAQRKPEEKSHPDQKVDNKILDDIRQEFPSFQDNWDKYKELTEKSRKKLHYVESFLKLKEISTYLEEYNDKNPSKLFLKSSLRRFFQVFYKWLKHPHKHEMNASPETRIALQKYLSAFEKVNKGLNKKNKRFKKDNNTPETIPWPNNLDESRNSPVNKPHLSDDDERDWKKVGNDRKKDEDTEDGVVSTLPLKKRKSTVKQMEIKNSLETIDKDESKSSCVENVSQAQNFLQDIDVDRFLSQIHGQENR